MGIGVLLVPKILLNPIYVISLNTIAVDEKCLGLGIVYHKVPATLMEELKGILILSCILVSKRERVADIILGESLKYGACNEIQASLHS